MWFSEPHYLIGKGQPLSRPLSRLPIHVSLYPSSRSRNCRSIGVSNYRSLEQIEKLSQYRCIELSIPRADRETVALSVYRTIDPSSKSRNCRIIGVSNYRSLEQIEKMSQYRNLEHCGMIASHIRPLPQTEGVWEDMQMLNDKTWCARRSYLKGSRPPLLE